MMILIVLGRKRTKEVTTCLLVSGHNLFSLWPPNTQQFVVMWMVQFYPIFYQESQWGIQIKLTPNSSAEAEVLRWRALVDDPNATDWARVRDNFPRSGASQSYMVNDPLLWYPYSHPPSRFEGSLQHDIYKSPNFNKQKINPWVHCAEVAATSATFWGTSSPG